MGLRSNPFNSIQNREFLLNLLSFVERILHCYCLFIQKLRTRDFVAFLEISKLVNLKFFHIIIFI